MVGSRWGELVVAIGQHVSYPPRDLMGRGARGLIEVDDAELE
jgi:hypothetical protein